MRCKRPSFRVRKVAFRIVKDGLLEGQRPSFENVSVIDYPLTPFNSYSYSIPLKPYLAINDTAKPPPRASVILSVSPFFTVFFVIVYVYKKKKSKTTGVSMTISKVEYGEQEIAKPSNRKISAILLLGGFQVFDKQGNNITGEFTPTLKLLFLFLLLNSIKGGKGTTSQRLEETFWFDMSKTSAANNRRVNIRKLRLILETVGEVQIVNKNDYWYIDMGKDTLCDYHQVCQILNAFEFYNSSNKEMIVNFVELASLGVLLPNVSTEWVDEYKSEYSHNVIELLLSISVREEIGKDNKLLLKIADIILMHDCTDEDAIRIKCRALFLSGQKGLAKQCFDKYCADYNRLLNTSPEFTYDDVICES